MNINLTLIGQLLTFVVFVWFTMKYVWTPIMGGTGGAAQRALPTVWPPESVAARTGTCRRSCQTGASRRQRSGFGYFGASTETSV